MKKVVDFELLERVEHLDGSYFEWTCAGRNEDGTTYFGTIQADAYGEFIEWDKLEILETQPCDHHYNNKKTALKVTGGFMFADLKCEICGHTCNELELEAPNKTAPAY